MSLEEKFNMIRVTEDGIRYKKKRKHHETKQITIFKESDLNKNLPGDGNNQEKTLVAESKGKRLKQSKKEDIGLSKNLERERLMNIMEDDHNTEYVNKEVIKKDEEKEKTLKISKIVLQSNEIAENKNNIQTNTNKNITNEVSENYNSNLNNNNLQLGKSKNPIHKSLPVSSSGESDVKKLLNTEFEKVKSATSKLEENFTKEHMASIVKLLKSFSNKYSKNSTKNLKVKVANLFSDDNFKVDATKYSQKSTLINLELLFFDLLLDKNNLYQSLIEIEGTNIGNILLYYFSQICLIKILNSIIPILKSNLEKYSDVLVIKVKNVENLANENKLFAIGLFYNLMKENYSKCAKLEKMARRGKQISNEYDNMIYSDIISIMSKSIDFKMIHCFEFESVQDVFCSNVNYIDIQMKSSSLYHKIIKHANDEAIENNQKKIKISRIKKELTANHLDIFNRITNMGVFYANTSDLIVDFLEG